MSFLESMLKESRLIAEDSGLVFYSRLPLPNVPTAKYKKQALRILCKGRDSGCFTANHSHMARD